jgi:hypothetical protein
MERGIMMLDRLGPRLCIMGPSNSGKSTLACAIAAARGLPVVHLDRLYHLPDTDWTPRPAEDFVALHDAAIAGPRWIMEGNYSRCLPQRLARATGLILLDMSAGLSLARYLRRSLLGTGRVGGLSGGRDRVTWRMIRHIAVVTPGNRARYRRMFDGLDLPKLALPSRRAIAAFYRSEGLRRDG